MTEFLLLVLLLGIIFFFVWVSTWPSPKSDVDADAQALLDKFLQELTDLSADPTKLTEGLALIKRADYGFTGSQAIYKLALKFLEANPESIQCRVFALEVGRWSFSLGRKDGLITAYDESALLNDIQARSR